MQMTSWWRHLCKPIKPLFAQLCALFFIYLYDFKWHVLLWQLLHIDYIYCGLFYVAVGLFKSMIVVHC